MWEELSFFDLTGWRFLLTGTVKLGLISNRIHNNFYHVQIVIPSCLVNGFLSVFLFLRSFWISWSLSSNQSLDVTLFLSTMCFAACCKDLKSSQSCSHSGSFPLRNCSSFCFVSLAMFVSRFLGGFNPFLLDCKLGKFTDK